MSDSSTDHVEGDQGANVAPSSVLPSSILPSSVLPSSIMASSTRRRIVGALSMALLAVVAICLVIGYGLPGARPTATQDVARNGSWTPEQTSDATVDDSSPPTNRAEREATRTPAAPPDDVTFEPLPSEPKDRIQFLRNEAIETAETLIEDLPGQANPISLRALICSRFGQTDKAIETWRQCLEIEPDFASAYVGLGTIAMELGEYEEAERHYRKALEIEPKVADARSSLAESLMKQSRMRDAIAIIEEDMESSSKSLTSLFHLGQAHLQLGEYDAAIKYFNTAIKIEPNLTNAHYGLANAYRRLGERKKAAASLKTFQALKKFDLKIQKQRTRAADDETGILETAAFVHFIAGDVYAHNHKLSKAVAHWIRAAKLDPKEVQSRDKLTQVFTETGDFETVVTILKELQAIEDANPVHCLNLGMIYTRMRKYDAAERAYRQAIELTPNSPIAMMALAEFLLNGQRNLPEARLLAERGVSLEPSAQNHAILCMTRASTHDYAAALRAIEQALKQSPEDLEFQRLRQQLRARIANDKTN